MQRRRTLPVREAERKESSRLLMRHSQTVNRCTASRRVLRGIVAPILRRETANQAIDSAMRRLRTAKDFCSFTLMLPSLPHRSALFRRHHQLVLFLFDLGQRFGSLSELQKRAFRSDSVHQQNRIHSTARLTHRSMRSPLDHARSLFAQRNRQQSPTNDSQRPALRRLWTSRAAPESDESRE